MKNDMRDRLVELVYVAIHDYDYYLDECHENEQTPHIDFEEYIADTLFENGAILPPCKRGDMVYCIRYSAARTPYVKELEVRSVTVYGQGEFTVFTTKEDVFGKTVFLTREEAEEALRNA